MHSLVSLEAAVAAAIFVSLTLYALMGGADFGGGVWDLLATGPRAGKQRALIAEALAPIWEANHVWLILCLVLTFVCFPEAFAAIMISLHIPLTLMLIGIVLRGAAFTFRHYDTQRDDVQQRWGTIFAISSTFTPVMLGICAGTIASGRILASNAAPDFFVWLAPFPFAVGAFALVLFAFVAAAYLAAEATDDDLREDFRKRALAAAVLLGVIAFVTFGLSFQGAPLIRAGLTDRPWSWPLHILTGVSATGAMVSLIKGEVFAARLCAVAQTVFILSGWAVAQFPYLVFPSITIYNSAAPQATLKAVLAALIAGLAIVIPSFYVLYRVFKGAQAFSVGSTQNTMMLKRTDQKP